MDDKLDPTTNECTLWHVPSGTVLLATEVRDEVMQLATTMLGEGMPAGHLRLQCGCTSERLLNPHAGVLLTMASHKWR